MFALFCFFTFFIGNDRMMSCLINFSKLIFLIYFSVFFSSLISIFIILSLSLFFKTLQHNHIAIPTIVILFSYCISNFNNYFLITFKPSSFLQRSLILIFKINIILQFLLYLCDLFLYISKINI